MLDDSMLDSAAAGLGFSPLSTGIARKSMIPIQRRPGAPSDDPEDDAGFLEVDDDGLFDDMLFSGELENEEDDQYGVYPVVRKSRFIESFGPTSAQPIEVPGRGNGMSSRDSLEAALAGLGR